MTINAIIRTFKPRASPSAVAVNTGFLLVFSFLQLELNILNKEFGFELGHEFIAKPRKYIEVVLWPESFCNKAAQRGKKKVYLCSFPQGAAHLSSLFSETSKTCCLLL